MIRPPPRSTRTDTPFPTRRSSDLCAGRVACNVARIRQSRNPGPRDGTDCAAPRIALVPFASLRRHAKRFACRRDGGVDVGIAVRGTDESGRSEEHTSELQSLMRRSYAVFCLNKKNTTTQEI